MNSMDKLLAIEARVKSPTFTDQTKIPVGGDFGDMELQAVRSTLSDDKKKIADQTNTIEEQQIEITKLQEQINQAPQTVKTTPNTVSTSGDTPIYMPTTSYKFAPWVPDFLKSLLAG